MTDDQTEQIEIVSLNILGRNFKIKCPSLKIYELEEAKNYVENEMMILKGKENITSIDTIAIITALNIAHQNLKEKKDNSSLNAVRTRIKALTNKIAATVKNSKSW